MSLLHQVRVDSSIVSNKEIGGLQSDMKLIDLQESVKKSYAYADGKVVLHQSTSIVSIAYLVERSLFMQFDIFTGRLFRLIAVGDYRGGFNGKIFIGDKVKKLLAIDNEFGFYATGGLMNPNFPGICIYVNDDYDIDLHDFDSASDMLITGIGVIPQFDVNGQDVYRDIYGMDYPKSI